MDESKKAAKAFVDQYFPMREPSPKSFDVWEELFPPYSKREFPKRPGYGHQSLINQSAVADGKFQGNQNKTQKTPQKEHCEISEPCLMSSSVDYGCRDNYPYNPDNRYPGPSSYIEKKDAKYGSDYAKAETSGAEWWQGSFYY